MAAEGTQKQVETVEMEDGSKVEFAGKRKLLKSHTIDAHGHVKVRFDFRNGMVREYTLNSYPVEHGLLRFAGHGAEQKFGDATAGIESVDDMVLAIEQVNENLAKGDWSSRVEGSGLAGASLIIKALMEAGNKTVEEVRTWVDDTCKAQGVKRNELYAALKTTKKIRAIIERLEGEKAAKATKVDPNAALASLGA